MNLRVSVLVILAALGATAGSASAAQPLAAGIAPQSGSSDWKRVSAGGSHTCGIRTTGRLYCWGADGSGQLGDGGANTGQSIPVRVGGRTDWAAVTAGLEHTCARRTSGRLFCWGYDVSGQLGDGGANVDQTTPVEVAGGRTDWAGVTAGDYHTCARRTTGRLYCWGRDDSGQLGDGDGNSDRPTPVQVAGDRTDWTAVDAGAEHTCARRTSGRLFCWGFDFFGQLGDGGTDTDRPTPVQVAGGRTDWATVDAGQSHTCARRTTGRLYCWGSDLHGQLGDGGGNTDRPTPVQVAGGRTDWTAVAAGGSHTCARRTSGRIFCWGSDGVGELGDGGTNTDRPTPVQVAGGATDWTAVAAGGSHTCARTTTGRLYCWGYDFFGQLGDGGADTEQPRPSEVFAP